MNNWIDAITDKLREWWDSFIHKLPDLLLVILIMIAAIIIGKQLRKWSYRLLFRISNKRAASKLISTITQIIVILFAFFISLDILQLHQTFSSLLAGAGIIGIILGFALQDITANFISGIYITFKRPFDIGHTIKTNDFIGNVEEIQLRSTVIRTFSGLHLMIPNRDIIQKPLINYSLTRERRIELEFFIDSATDLSKAHKAITDAMTRIAYLFPGKPVEIYYNDFRENAVKISVWFWIDNHAPPGYMVARHDAIFYILESLKEQSITLVVPMSLQSIKMS